MVKSKREELYEAVIEGLVEDGYHKCSLSKIGERLHITKQGVAHYGSKDSIILNALSSIQGNKESLVKAAVRVKLDCPKDEQLINLCDEIMTSWPGNAYNLLYKL